MKKLLFGGKNNFYKGNLHCHSNLSDGKLTPAELKEYYKSHGYSILAITDHEFLNNNSYLDDEDFLTITSSELAIKEFPEQSTLKNFNMKVCHLNVYAKEQDNVYNAFYNSVYDHYSSPEIRANLSKPEKDVERPYSTEGINNLIKIANDNGFFVAYNHPRWSLENYREYSGYEGLWGVEIYNSSVNHSGIYEYDINVHDDFLRDGKRLFITSGDDNHNHKDDSFGTFCMIEADKLEYSEVINSLLNGNFYVSNGPLIYEISVEDNKVTVNCSNAKKVSLSTFGRRSATVTAPEGEHVNEAVFELKDTDVYFRISVLDEFGCRADSQSYFLDTI
ncbi:MAG: hypothetical protein IKD04_04980 [Clostridia bacterium]|nr:hypothetical protein [Clostridia bacterium]